jgi:hypothetical protein
MESMDFRPLMDQMEDSRLPLKITQILLLRIPSKLDISAFKLDRLLSASGSGFC